MFDEGKIVEEGTPDEMFDNPKNDRIKEFLSRVRASLKYGLQMEQRWDSVADYEASRIAVRKTPGITSVFDQI